MSNKLNVGLIGAGRIGNVHARNIKFQIPKCQLLAISDVYKSAADQLARELEIPSVYQDHRQLLADPQIQAVLICSSTDTHAKIIEDAAAAGKHIFCEKPIDHELSKIDRALAAVEKAGVKLQIGFNRRFDPNYRAVYDAIRAGRIGEPHILRITSRDPAPPPLEYIKVSGGMFLDMTIHDFDMARFLIGSEIESVYAVAGVRVDPAIGAAGDVDTAIITLKFKDGTIGSIDNSRKAAYGYDQRVEVFGSRGMIASENDTSARTVFADSAGVHSPLPLNFFMDRYTESYLAELHDFVTSIMDNKPTLINGVDGRMPVVAALAAKESLNQKRPIPLSEIEVKVSE